MSGAVHHVLKGDRGEEPDTVSWGIGHKRRKDQPSLSDWRIAILSFNRYGSKTWVLYDNVTLM